MPVFFADILLPLSIERRLTYVIPPEMKEDVQVGKRVIVPVGRNKLYAGIVSRIHQETPSWDTVKPIQSVLDDEPLVLPKQLEFWDWIAGYYLCHAGEVMNAAMPSALRLQSETVVSRNADVAGPIPDDLDTDEYFILDLLEENKQVTVQEIQRLIKGRTAQKKLKRLLERGLVLVAEEVDERFRPLKESRIRISEAYASDSSLEELFRQFEADARKQKQTEALLYFLKRLYETPDKTYVRKRDLFQEDAMVSASSLQTLIRNGVLEEFQAVIDRIAYNGEPVRPLVELSPAQETTRQEITAHWQDKDTVLLHGATSSGKTEIYLHLIQQALERGEQVLYLVPEIALTTQLIQRLRKHLGGQVGVYHSRYSGNERVEVWNKVLRFASGEEQSSCRVVIGARSSLFLPYSRLGLVIVDEEHDSSFKQFDPAPRYHARDAAIMLARQHHAKVLLGSATPALETYFNARQGRYGLVTLTERYGGMPMPEIIIADVKEALRKKRMKSHFTPELLDLMGKALSAKEQVILFQNRRGFSSFLECRQCGWIPHCKHCSVTMTYHKYSHQLRCHYCGFAQEIPVSCGACNDTPLLIRGFGTEKIEEELPVFFPDHPVARLDLDTASSKTSYQRIISDFEEQRVDVLVGTQMIAKGLDFEHVSTVGILDADMLLNFPDFRAHERSFQLMSQVSGRSGRKHRRGKVVIQTKQHDHWVIRDVVNHDYEAFYFRELENRSHFGYPPHSRLIEISLRHKDENLVHEAAQRFFLSMRNRLEGRVHGPHIPVVSKIRNQYYRTMLIRIPREEAVTAAKTAYRESVKEFYQEKMFASVQIIPDVDPA